MFKIYSLKPYWRWCITTLKGLSFLVTNDVYPLLDLLVRIYKNGCMEIFFVFNNKIDCLVSVVIVQYFFPCVLIEGYNVLKPLKRP